MALLESLAVKHQPGQQDLLTMPGAFRGILKVQLSTPSLVCSLPGRGSVDWGVQIKYLLSLTQIQVILLGAAGFPGTMLVRVEGDGEHL